MSAEKDEIIIELFSSLKELSELRKKFDTHVTEGYVGLAKTRYNIGALAGGMISRVQYPTEMTATTLVDCSDGDKESIKGMNWYQLTSSSSLPATTTTSQTSQTGSSQLRQRKGVPSVAVNVDHDVEPSSVKTADSTNSTTAMVNSSTVHHKGVDPIRWFSALPPSSLRNSQQQFKQGLEVAIGIANIQRHIEELRKRYVELMKQDTAVEPDTITPSLS